MLPTYCPQCRSIRQPNGQFCHMCGYSYVERTPAEASEVPIASRTPRLSIGDGFRFGIGFTIATTILTIIFAVIWLVAFAGLLSGLLRAVPS